MEDRHEPSSRKPGSFFIPLSVISILALAAYSAFTCSLATGLNLGAAGGIFIYGYQSYLRGFWFHFRRLAHLTFAIAAAFAGQALILQYLTSLNVAGRMMAFSGSFIISFILLKFLSRSLLAPLKPPGHLSALCGSLSGIVEAIIILSVAGFVLTIFPLNFPNRESVFFIRIGMEIDRQFFAPYLEAEEKSSPLVLLKVAQEAKYGIDPQKVDREALQTQLRKIFTAPEIKALAEDKELMERIESHDIPGILSHPRFVELIQGQAIEGIVSDIDWKEVSRALRCGIKKPESTD